MGCAASQHKHSQIVAVKRTPGQVLTSSGLQTNPDDLGNGNFPLGSEGNENGKMNSLGPSLSSCQDLNQDVQTLEAIPSKEDLTSVKLPPKDVFPENFSFFRVPEIITQKVKIESARPPSQPSSENLSESKVIPEGKGLSTNLPKRPRRSIENRTQGLHPPILIDISNTSLRNSSATDGKSKESEGVLSTQKVTPDFIGATFSFMNIKPENQHQPFVFFTEENKLSHNYSAKFFQNSLYNRSFQKSQEGNHGEFEKRLGVLSEGSAVSSCESFSIENQESHESKPNEFKKVMRFRRTRGEHHEKRISTQNIQTVVNGPPTFGQGGSISTNIGSVQTVVSINNISGEEVKKPITTSKFATHKFTRNLVELIRSPKNNQAEPKKIGFSRTERLKQRVEEKNNVIKSARGELGLQVKNSERANSKPHLLNLSPGDDEELEESDIQVENVEDTLKPPLEFKNLELQEDGYETSPNAQSSCRNLRTPKTQFTSMSNSPINQADGSTFLDRTIYNIQDNITQMDLDKYSLYEVLGNIELDDQKSESGGLQGNRILDDKILDTSFNNGYFQNPNLKSTQDEQVSVLPVLTRPRPKSVTGLNQCKGGSTPNSEANGGQDYTPKKTHRKHSDFSKTSTSVIETKQVDKSVDDEGQKKINQYIMVKKLGQGSFGKVKLAINDAKEKFAIKIANKHQLKRKMLSRTKSAFTQLATEVAIMKKMDHPNIVRLFEVMDDPNNENLYIVMEYVKKGPVLSRNYWRSEMSESNKFAVKNVKEIPTNRLTEEKAKKYFRHLVLALDYLHNQMGIIHRDIKPENLLIAEDDTLKVSDFGISKIMEDGDDILDNNAGTKLFLAPETWKGKSFHGKPADIWAAGGTLYYFLTGKSPFTGLAIDDVKRKILEDEVKFPSGIDIDPKIKELVLACLRKDPQERITLEEIMQNAWLTDNGENPLVNHNDDVVVNEEDVSKALTKISFMARVRLTAKIKQRARANAERRKSQEIQKVPSFISQKKG